MLNFHIVITKGNHRRICDVCLDLDQSRDDLLGCSLSIVAIDQQAIAGMMIPPASALAGSMGLAPTRVT